MEDFLVSKSLTIQSHKGKYTANFIRSGMDALNDRANDEVIYVVDKRVSQLYEARLKNVLDIGRVLRIEAIEANKSLHKFPEYIDELLSLEIRRGQPLVAIGGGIIQDITCFLAATMMRGLPWIFYPTTLLAQSDSCIGSKSSINSGDIKNILGTFTPPAKVVIDVDFLETLGKNEIYSGIGEMLKVHAINSPQSFDRISDNYEAIIKDPFIMEQYIHDSLLMKKKIIEIDEFDQGPRNVMNYGHSFGHAIESATNYDIPHGVAVSIGMDVANFVAAELGVSNPGHFNRMHTILDQNCATYRNVYIDVKVMMKSLLKDKKNSRTQFRLVLPDEDGCIAVGLYDNNSILADAINKYFTTYRVN